MTTIPSARISKPNWLEFDLKHCSILTNDKCGTILIRDSIVTGLSRYQDVWNGNFFFNTLNCGRGVDKVQNVLWQGHNLPAVKIVKNVIIMCSTNNTHLDAPGDADGIIKTGLTLKRLYINVNVFICEILPCDYY